MIQPNFHYGEQRPADYTDEQVAELAAGMATRIRARKPKQADELAVYDQGTSQARDNIDYMLMMMRKLTELGISDDDQVTDLLVDAFAYDHVLECVALLPFALLRLRDAETARTT